MGLPVAGRGLFAGPLQLLPPTVTFHNSDRFFCFCLDESLWHTTLRSLLHTVTGSHFLLRST